jgi:HEPN domain-containing protein
MHNRGLAHDHVRRAEARLKAVDALFGEASWADVVRESQEVVELALKGLLRTCGVEAPRMHDVSGILAAESQRLPEGVQGDVPRLAAISKDLRRDRELAFDGAEDITPSSFYTRDDAERARNGARWVVGVVKPATAGAE